MNKIKVIGLGLFFSLFFVACGGSSSSSPTPGGDRDGGGERVSQNLSPKSLSFTYGETSFKTLEVTSDKAGKGKYSVTSSNNKAVATAISNSVGLVRVTPIGVGDAIITVKREGDASYDSAETEITIIVEPQEQNLKVNLGYTASDRWKLSKYATATISIAARSVGGVGGDGDLVGSTASYSIKKIESSTTGDQKPVVAAKVEAGEIIITATSTGDATVTVSNGGGDNYKEGKVVIFITVNEDATQAALNSSTTDVAFDGYGETANKNIRVTGGTTGDVVVTSSHPDVVTVPTGIVSNGEITITPLSAGTAVITVTRKGGVSSDGVTTYNPISKDIRVSISKPTLPTLIADPSSFSATYDKGVDTTSSMASGSSSTGDYYIKSSKPDVATASITASGAITVTFEDAGTTDITITRAGNYKYRSSSTATIDVEVTKATQTLMAPPPSSISATYVAGGDTTSITITGGKGTGSFDTPTSSTPDVATASINESGTLTVALNLGGTTNITVRKRGDRNYEDSDPLKIAVTIDKALQKISIFGGETRFQQKLGSKPVTVAILGAKGEGLYTEPTVDHKPVAPEAPVVASASIAGNELTLTVLELGRAVVTFRKNGDRNYKESNLLSIEVEVTTQENQVFTLGTSEFSTTYQTTILDQTTEISTTGGGGYTIIPGDDTVATVAVANGILTVTFVNVGKTTIFVYRAGNANFNRSRTIPITVTVTKATQEIAVAAGSKSEFVLDYGDTTTTILTGGKASYADNISISKDGVVRVSIRGSNSDELFIEAIGSGTAEIEVFASGEDRNYKQSNTLTITVKVNRIAQELTARPSTFSSLTYNETTTSDITTNAVYFDDEGEYGASSSNTNIVTTDIDLKSGLLSLRAVGVTDTTVTITITKQQDIRYEAATIEIPITKVIRADQPLTSSVIGRLSFDKPGDTTTVTISDGLSGEEYTAISDNEAIVRAAITAGSLTITAVATGDTIVRIVRATGDNYNAADLAIEVRVKKQQTLSSVGAVSSFKYKYKNSQSAGRITGGQGTAGYQSSSTPTGIVTTDVDANGVLFITTVSTGDTTISIYKEGDKDYNRSDPISLSLNVARGVVPLDYATTDTTIKYSPTIKTTIDFVAPMVVIEPNTVFTYTVTTSDNVITRGHKIDVSVDTANRVVVSTLNASTDEANIRVTRARTPYYEQATADISVTVEKATRALKYTNPNLTIVYNPNVAATAMTDLRPPTDVDTNFRYSHELITNTDANDNYNKISVVRDPVSNNITVTAINAHDDPATIIVTRDGTPNYKVATAVIRVRVNKATLDLEYDNPSPSLTYKIEGDTTTVRLVDPEIEGTSFIYRFASITNNAYGEDEDAYTVLEVPIVTTVLPNGNLTVVADNASPISTSTGLLIPAIIRVTRTGDSNYKEATIDIFVTVEKATLALAYANPSPSLTYMSTGTTVSLAEGQVIVGAGFIYTVTDITKNAHGDGALVLSAPSMGDSTSSGSFTLEALNASPIPEGSSPTPTRLRVTRAETRNYNEATADIDVTVNRANLPIRYLYTESFVLIGDNDNVSVDFFTKVRIQPTGISEGMIDTYSLDANSRQGVTLELLQSQPGKIDIVSETLTPVTFLLNWEGRNYEDSRTLNVVTSKKTPTFEYTSIVELTFAASEDVMQTRKSIDDIRLIDREYARFSLDYDTDIISAVEKNTANSSGTISITPKGFGTTTLRVEKTFVNDSIDYYNSVSTNITVNVSGVQLAHVATTDITLGTYSGLTTVASGDSDYLFIAGQPISGRKVSNAGIFSSTIGGAITASADSITSAQIGGNTYILTANRQKSEVRVYSVANNGDLSLVKMISDTPSLEIGGASALTTAVVNSKLFLLVAGSTDDGVSAFFVINASNFFAGSRFRAGAKDDYIFEGASALTTAIIDDKPFLFVAGKDDNAVGVYELNESLDILNLISNDGNTQDITGALSLATVSTDTKFFLYAAGSTGVRELEVSSLGAIAPPNPNTPQLLTSGEKDTFVTVAQKGATNFLFAAYGNTLEAYVIDDDGVRRSSKVTYTDAADSKFGGVSSLTTATIEGKLFLFVAGSSDNGVSVFEVRYLAP